MNNYAEITIKGKKLGLTFGMIAAEEFYKIITERGDTPQNSIGTLQSGDVIYAGACNEALLQRKPRPDYRTIIEWVEEAYSDETGELLIELNNAMEVFTDSRFSKNLQNATEALKKKIAEANGLPKLDWDKIKQFAYGRLNLKPLEYAVIPPYEFDIMVKARHERDKQIEKQGALETRLICWYIYRANADPKTAVKNIEDFMPLDGKPKRESLNKKQLQQQAAKLGARLNKK